MNSILKKRLLKLSTTHICDASQNIRVLPNLIKPLFFSANFVGNAFTVKCDGDLLPVIKALEIIKNDSVLIIDTGNSEDAILGEIFTTMAKNKGVQAIIINGFCRDILEIKNLGIPLYAKGTSPKAGTKCKLGLTQINLDFSGIIVQPYDVIFGDENGVILFSENEAELLITQAEAIKKREEMALIKIKNGNSLNVIFNFSEHYKNITDGVNQSELIWKDLNIFTQ